jgi:hypothetical protein
VVALGSGRFSSKAALAHVLVVSFAGCTSERPLTESDCTAIKQKVAAAWNHDAVAAQRLADSDAFTPFIGEEGDRVAAAVLEECRAMVGKPISEKELSCLKAADTIDDVYECAPR